MKKLKIYLGFVRWWFKEITNFRGYWNLYLDEQHNKMFMKMCADWNKTFRRQSELHVPEDLSGHENVVSLTKYKKNNNDHKAASWHQY